MAMHRCAAPATHQNSAEQSGAWISQICTSGSGLAGGTDGASPHTCCTQRNRTERTGLQRQQELKRKVQPTFNGMGQNRVQRGPWDTSQAPAHYSLDPQPKIQRSFPSTIGTRQQSSQPLVHRASFNSKPVPKWLLFATHSQRVPDLQIRNCIGGRPQQVTPRRRLSNGLLEVLTITRAARSML